MAISPDNRWAATCSRDNSLHLWNATTGELRSGRQASRPPWVPGCDHGLSHTAANVIPFFAAGHAEGLFISDAWLSCCVFAGSTLFAGDDSGNIHLLALPQS